MNEQLNLKRVPYTREEEEKEIKKWQAQGYVLRGVENVKEGDFLTFSQGPVVEEPKQFFTEYDMFLKRLEAIEKRLVLLETAERP